ncbi:MAG: UDP-glucose 4-epimerase GalE [Candidatus Latescibacteria bacterium]|jgi:UDP-glucose 4-epimerase|nr:UDP-glucose 4-epimerase GalE [Candidatus Latescibacterota bacterium]
MKYLVTGAAGYIGSVCVELLLDAGHDVFAIDDLRQGNRSAIESDATFYKASLGDRTVLDKVFSQGIDAVFHLAAEISVPQSMADPGLYYETNVNQGLCLLEAMRAAGCKCLIFSSTAAVFGEPATTPIDESHPKVPCNPYGDSKLSFERLLNWYHVCFGFRVHIFRYFNAAGATERHGEDRSIEEHLIPLAFAAIKGQRERLTVFGDDYPTSDGTCVRDYLHVRDIGQAHLQAAAYLGQNADFDDFNLGSSSGTTVLTVLKTIERVTGYSVPYVIGERRAGDPAALVASSEKAVRKLGIRFDYSHIDYIIESAWKWFRQTERGR